MTQNNANFAVGELEFCAVTVLDIKNKPAQTIAAR
jgi:hypothetical protein